MELHLISNGKMPLHQFVTLCKNCHEQLDGIHIRQKHLSTIELYQWASTLIINGVPKEKIYMNDRVEVAHVLSLKGVQLAWNSLPPDVVKQYYPDHRLGKSIHSVAEACVASALGVDYLLFGHVYETKSKPGKEPQGLITLKEVVKAASVPVLAIGGITPPSVGEILKSGAAGIAVMSTILEADDPLAMINEYRKEERRFYDELNH